MAEVVVGALLRHGPVWRRLITPCHPRVTAMSIQGMADMMRAINGA